MNPRTHVRLVFVAIFLFWLGLIWAYHGEWVALMVGLMSLCAFGIGRWWGSTTPD
jgi:hypothetical protein